MTLWFCDKCLFNESWCGPWDDDDKSFVNIKKIHQSHLGFQEGQPGLKIQVETSLDQMFHELVSELKGTEKSCLVKEKWKWFSRV